MSLLSTLSAAFQSLSACMIARSWAYAYFLETVIGKSEVKKCWKGAPRRIPVVERRHWQSRRYVGALVGLAPKQSSKPPKLKRDTL